MCWEEGFVQKSTEGLTQQDVPGFSPVCFAANGAGKEQAALGEEHGAEAVKLLQGQEEERLRGARGAEDEGQRGVSTQVGQESGCCRVHCLAGRDSLWDILLQVEKEKDLELKEKFDALRREHEETLQGEIPGQSNAPHNPQPLPRASPAHVALWDVGMPPLVSSCQ